MDIGRKAAFRPMSTVMSCERSWMRVRACGHRPGGRPGDGHRYWGGPGIFAAM